jgi:hypothetical protein
MAEVGELKCGPVYAEAAAVDGLLDGAAVAGEADSLLTGLVAAACGAATSAADRPATCELAVAT